MLYCLSSVCLSFRDHFVSNLYLGVFLMDLLQIWLKHLYRDEWFGIVDGQILETSNRYIP